MKITVLSCQPVGPEDVKESIEHMLKVLGRPYEGYSISYIIQDDHLLPTPGNTAMPWDRKLPHQKGKGPRGKWNKLR